MDVVHSRTDCVAEMTQTHGNISTNIKPFVHRTFSVFKVLLFALSTRIRIIITHKLISYKWVKMCTYVHVTTHSDEITTPEHT